MMRAKRSVRLLVSVMILALLPLAQSMPIAIVISTGSGGWTVSATGKPTVAGNNFSTTTYTSATNQTVLRVNRNPGGWMTGGKGWIVYVHKNDTATWNGNLQLWIRRTNNPAPGLSGGPGLNVYTQLTSTDQEFFRCTSQTQVTNIRCQLEIRGASANVLVQPSDVTSVVYTVTEY